MADPRSGEYATCPFCDKRVQVTSTSLLRAHGPRNDRCWGSGMAAFHIGGPT